TIRRCFGICRPSRWRYVTSAAAGLMRRPGFTGSRLELRQILRPAISKRVLRSYGPRPKSDTTMADRGTRSGAEIPDRDAAQADAGRIVRHRSPKPAMVKFRSAMQAFPSRMSVEADPQ